MHSLIRRNVFFNSTNSSLRWLLLLRLGVNGADGPPTQPLWRSKDIQISYLSLLASPHTPGVWDVESSPLTQEKILIFMFGLYTNPSVVVCESCSNMEVGPCTMDFFSKFGWGVWTILNDTYSHIAKTRRCFRVLVQYCNTVWIDWMLDMANISLMYADAAFLHEYMLYI